MDVRRGETGNGQRAQQFRAPSGSSTRDQMLRVRRARTPYPSASTAPARPSALGPVSVPDHGQPAQRQVEAGVAGRRDRGAAGSRRSRCRLHNGRRRPACATASRPPPPARSRPPNGRVRSRSRRSRRDLTRCPRTTHGSMSTTAIVSKEALPSDGRGHGSSHGPRHRPRRRAASQRPGAHGRAAEAGAIAGISIRVSIVASSRSGASGSRRSSLSVRVMRPDSDPVPAKADMRRPVRCLVGAVHGLVGHQPAKRSTEPCRRTCPAGSRARGRTARSSRVSRDRAGGWMRGRSSVPVPQNALRTRSISRPSSSASTKSNWRCPPRRQTLRKRHEDALLGGNDRCRSPAAPSGPPSRVLRREPERGRRRDRRR
jgi:hypothetical protein